MDYDFAPHDMPYVTNDLQQEEQEEGNERGDEIGSAANANERKQSRDSSSSAGKLFVGGVSWETTEETFSNYFSKYGEIMDCVIMMDRHSGRPRGFGFVTFVDPAVADRVLAEDHVIDGRTVEVKRTVPREDMEGKAVVLRTRKIFVGGLPAALTEDDLRDYFSFYGKIAEHQIMLDHKTERSRGFGFVTFESEDSVERIFSEGKLHEIGGKQVEIKKAEPRRAGGDYSSSGKSYAGFGNGSRGLGSTHGSGGRQGGKMGRGHGGYGDYTGYGGYGSYGGGYGGNAAGFFGGYGGYGYGFGYSGPMMYGAGVYGGGGYGAPGGYGSTVGYGGGEGFGRMGTDSSFGNVGDKGYGNGGTFSGGYGSGKGYGGGSANGAGGVPGRHHPYRK